MHVGHRWMTVGHRAGAAPDADGVIRKLDPYRPIYDIPRVNIDVFTAYYFKLYRDRIRGRLQLNINNVNESGRLAPIAVNPDGSAWNFRIVDPRQFILSLSFDL